MGDTQKNVIIYKKDRSYQKNSLDLFEIQEKVGVGMNMKKEKNFIKICLIGILVLYYMSYLSTWAVNRWALYKEIEGYVKVLIDIQRYSDMVLELAAPVLAAVIIWKVIMLFSHILEDKSHNVDD
nr:hypothetical protein [uncultured Sellimonas sp.]